MESEGQTGAQSTVRSDRRKTTRFASGPIFHPAASRARVSRAYRGPLRPRYFLGYPRGNVPPFGVVFGASLPFLPGGSFGFGSNPSKYSPATLSVELSP